jgi:hypothetical protein
MEEKKVKGGARVGAGRKSLVDEESVNFVLLSTLKELHKTDNDLDAKKGFVKDLLESQRGQLFVAEHIFGKPKETIDQNVNLNSFELKDIVKFDNAKS